MKREGKRLTFNFANAATAASETHSVESYAMAVFYMPAEFNGDTLTIKSSVSDDTGFTITGATGRVALDSDQLASFAPMKDMTITTSSGVSAAAVITVDVKS